MVLRNRLFFRAVKSAATTATLAYGTYRLASWAWNLLEYGDGDRSHNHKGERPQIQRRRRQEQPVRVAFEDFLPKLRATIDARTNVSQARKELKRLRRARAAQSRIIQQPKDSLEGEGSDNKLANNQNYTENDNQEEMALWEEMKVKIILGTVGTAYCQVLLYLLLYVQWHLLLSDSNSDTQEGADHTQNTYVRQLVMSSTFEYFFAHTVPRVLRHLQNIIQQNLSNWNVMECLEMSFEDFHRGIQSIRQKEYETNGMTPLIQFVIPYDQEEDILPSPNNIADEQEKECHRKAQYILNETWDILESPTFTNAQNDSLSIVLDLLKKHGYAQIFFEDASDNHHKVQESRPPLANVISQIKQLVVPTFYEYPTSISTNGINEWTLIPSSLANLGQDVSHQFPNIYIQHMEKLPIVMELGDVCLM